MLDFRLMIWSLFPSRDTMNQQSKINNRKS